ncbi:stress response protein nst1 [Punica granatum]|uniref:Stress response protein nst1 n=1 Tax=Punica granatum TaxID=22663 RepID=A0A6P8DGP5_PUNGR|nr:stress response protein nst1 [Punica granatum]
MCILCVIQKWSRRVATMLPWLVLPLIGLWALSQLLPPAFRFEITSPRLACVFVLLVTLFWYEILMPKLSAWRARRNARLRERKRNEAIELQKLRKTATRKCRNCLTPYRDQNPGGGKFMCSYCGHISKRPVLELPVPPGMGMSDSGIFKDLVGKGGKLLNGRAWSDHGWMCSQDWRDSGNWAAGSFASKPVNYRKNGNVLFGGDESCLAEKSYSGIVIFASKLLTSFFLSIRWLWRKIFSGGSSSEDASFNAEQNGMLTKRGECGGNFQESKSEKARRKAEEKRQARLERELLEEEERKQREEVARLVEERRKLRDEKTGTEKDSEKVVSPTKDNHSKKDAEKRRHERRKDRDRGSSKSNSDAEELERRVAKETDWKHDSDKKSEADSREHQRSVMDNIKGQGNDLTRGSKSVPGNNVNRGSAGARYLDRMRGTLISSSKAFGGTSFFGRTANTSTTIPKESKSNNAVNHAHTSAPKRDLCTSERVAGKSTINAVPLEPQPIPAPKKSWQQLFTRSTPVHPSSNPSVISRPNTKMPAEVRSPPLPGQALVTQSFDRPISFGLPSPFPVYPIQNVTPSSSLGFSPAIEPIFPHLGEKPHENMPEEPELFEDPCYVPDPVSLLGPVSESLENFQLDLGSGFISDMELEKPRIPKTSAIASEISRPSPIESPMSRQRIVDDKHGSSIRLPTTPKSQEKHSSLVEDVNDEKTWQLWGPSPLGQDGLSIIGGPAWHLNPDRGRLNKEEFVRPPIQRTMASLFTKEDPVLPSTYSPQKDFLGSVPNGETFSPVGISNDKDPWLQKGFFPPAADNEKHFPFKRQEESTQNDIFFGTPARPTATHPFEPSPAKGWSNKEWAVADTGELVGNQSVGIPKIGEFFPPQMYSHFGTENGK